jgi:ribosomal protein S18 acetylase RimI-like enzyme
LPDDFFLSPLLPGDLEGIAPRLAEMDPWKTLGYSPDGLARYLRRDDPALFCRVARAEAGVAAVLCVRHPWLLGPFIELLACFDPFRGRGLGRKLVEWVERGAFPGSSNLWVTVSSFNVGARGFYRRMGFQEVTELKDLVRPGCDEILLRKRLGESVNR